jgi:hypothetical protein
MRNDKLIPGTILVIIGVLFLLDNFGYIDFSWFAFIRLWPILLVIGGVNLVFAHNKTNTATAIKVGVLIAGMAILIYNGLGHHNYKERGWRNAFNHFEYNDDDDDKDTSDNITIGANGTGRYVESYKPEIKEAVLNINGAATHYIIKDTTNNLFEGDTKGLSGLYNLKINSDSTSETLDFDMNGDNNHHHHGFNFTFGNGHGKSNTAFIKLNSAPEWEINVKAGAAKIDFDLTQFKIKNLKIRSGAADFDIKMGQPTAETNLDVSTAASNIIISVPKTAAVHITTKTALSQKSIDGFNSVSDNEYESANFDKAANKMYIKINGGISDFKVNRY